MTTSGLLAAISSKGESLYRKTASMTFGSDNRPSRSPSLRKLRHTRSESSNDSFRSSSAEGRRNIYRQPPSIERANSVKSSKQDFDLQRHNSYLRKHLRISAAEFHLNGGDTDDDDDVVSGCSTGEDNDARLSPSYATVRTGASKRRQRFSSSDQEPIETPPVSPDPTLKPPILKRTPSAESSASSRRAQFHSKVDVMYFDEKEKPRSVVGRVSSFDHLKRHCCAKGSTDDKENVELECRVTQTDYNDEPGASKSDPKSTAAAADSSERPFVTDNDIHIKRTTKEPGLELCIVARIPTGYGLSRIKAMTAGRTLIIVASRKTNSKNADEDKKLPQQLTQTLELNHTIDVYGVTSSTDKQGHVTIRAPVVSRNRTI